MMKIPYALIALAAVFILLIWRPWATGPLPEESAADRQIPGRPAVANPGLPDLEAPTLPVPHPAPVGLSPAEIQQVRDAIDDLEFVFRDYTVALGGNPVGTNAEITAALRGDNARQLKLDLPASSTVNADGELCDPWGTPWFFHQLSGTRMEIRSAGKDRRYYTEDDFVR